MWMEILNNCYYCARQRPKNELRLRVRLKVVTLKVMRLYADMLDMLMMMSALLLLLAPSSLNKLCKCLIGKCLISKCLISKCLIRGRSHMTSSRRGRGGFQMMMIDDEGGGGFGQ